MKQVITTLLIIIMAVTNAFGQLKIEDNSLKKSQGYTKIEWPELDADGNENPQQMLLRVIYDKFPQASVGQLKFNSNPDIPNAVRQIKDGTSVAECQLFLPLSTSVVSVTHPDYGATRITLPASLKDKDVYQVKITIDSKVNLDIEPFTDNGKGVTVVLDNLESKTTPARFYDVSVGSHKVDFNLNGKKVTRIIDVSPQNHIFTGENPDFDLRTKKNVKITTDKAGAKVLVDGVLQNGTTPLTLELPYGMHTIRAEYSASSRDEVTLDVNETSKSEVTLKPIERVPFKVKGRYHGSTIVGDLYVDGDPAYKYTTDGQDVRQEVYNFELPLGSSHTYKLTYRGNEGNIKLKTKRGMPSENYIEIKDRKKFTWPWERPYESSPLAFSAGYVQKQMVTTFQMEGEKEVVKEDGVWNDNEGGNLHGIQLGLQYQPAFWWGLGLSTGIFYEYYWSKNPNEDQDYYDPETDTYYFFHPKYDEHSLYMPVHLFYRIPFANRFSISFGGGLGLSYVIKGRYYGKKGVFSGMEGEYEEYSSFHGDDAYPQRFNMTADAILRVRFGSFMLCGQMGWGIYDHKSFKNLNIEYPDLSIKTVVNHNSLSLCYLF